LTLTLIQIQILLLVLYLITHIALKITITHIYLFLIVTNLGVIETIMFDQLALFLSLIQIVAHQILHIYFLSFVDIHRLP